MSFKKLANSCGTKPSIPLLPNLICSRLEVQFPDNSLRLTLPKKKQPRDEMRQSQTGVAIAALGEDMRAPRLNGQSKLGDYGTHYQPSKYNITERPEPRNSKPQNKAQPRNMPKPNQIRPRDLHERTKSI